MQEVGVPMSLVVVVAAAVVVVVEEEETAVAVAIEESPWIGKLCIEGKKSSS
jgi:hypothetical protein